MRFGLRTVILLTWVGIMLALWQRTLPREINHSELASDLPASASEVWQGIFQNDQKIGYSVRRRLVTDDGFRLEHQALLRLKMMGASRVVQTRVSSHTDRRLRLRDFHFRMTSGPVSFEIKGQAFSDELEIQFLPEKRSIQVPLSGPIVLSQTLPELLAAAKLNTGQKIEYAMFDPMSASTQPVEIIVGPLLATEIMGKKQEAYQLTQRYRGSEFLIWISPQGEVLREDGPLGLRIVREDRETATSAGFQSDSALDLVSAAAIPAGRKIHNPRQLSSMTVRITGVPDEHTIAWPPRQMLNGTLLQIKQEESATLISYPLPHTDRQFISELSATPFVQSNDQRIQEQVQMILKDERDAGLAARKIGDWVYTTLAKVPTVSVPNALGVLDSKQGDCNEHAVLYTALARAAGLPTRIVAGTIYMPDEHDGVGAFFYHAWVEVWLGRWTAIDPTFGQFPADATHVKFINGGPETHARLLNLLGRLQIEVEEPE